MFGGAALFTARLGLLDEAPAALDAARLGLLVLGAVLFAKTLGGAADEGVAARFAAADFSGALEATFPVLATVGRGVCDAGCDDTVVGCWVGDEAVFA